MWVQLDYAYFLAAVAKGVIGGVFGFVWLTSAPAGVGFGVMPRVADGGMEHRRDARARLCSRYR